jgi:hypothetical protein
MVTFSRRCVEQDARPFCERVVRLASRPPGVGSVVQCRTRFLVECRKRTLAFGAVMMLEEVLERRVTIEKLEHGATHGPRVAREATRASRESVDHPAELLVLPGVEHEGEARERSELRIARKEHRFLLPHGPARKSEYVLAALMS